MSWIIAGTVISIFALAIGSYFSKKKFKENGRSAPDDIYPLY